MRFFACFFLQQRFLPVKDPPCLLRGKIVNLYVWIKILNRVLDEDILIRYT